jgi:predicted secreted hydrolase
MRLRRLVVLPLLLLVLGGADEPGRPVYAVVQPGSALTFPQDHGAHPDYRTEWWYVTGWLHDAGGHEFGFQVTFFRTRPEIDERMEGDFVPHQILFAHAALSDPKLGHLLHDQRAARAGFGLAEASTGDMKIGIERWILARDPATGRMTTHIPADGFALDLTLDPTQPILLQGEHGYSQKGPNPTEASHYYSMPHLAVSGSVGEGDRTIAVTGEAWLDREYSSTYLTPGAVGWDWLGANLDDGGALMAFQIRDQSGMPIWAGGSLRAGDGTLSIFGPHDVRFTTEREWVSPRTGTHYPVERGLTVTLPGATRHWTIKPLFDDQELDSRAAGGPVYWEGAARIDGGTGYLELTGYMDPLKM